MNRPTSARIEGRCVRPLIGAAWRAGGLLYLGACLLGLAAGLWPDAIHPPVTEPRAAPLPTLQCLAVAQAAFILLVHPLILQARLGCGAAGAQPGSRPPADRAGDGGYWLRCAVETGMFLLVTAPFYAAAAWVSDAGAKDVVRAVLYVVLLWPVAWTGGLYLARGAGRSAAFVVLLLAALGLPAGWYIAEEFLPQWRADWLWQLGPLTGAWDVAASRRASWFPGPLWASMPWPAIALGGALLRLLLPHPAARPGCSDQPPPAGAGPTPC